MYTLSMNKYMDKALELANKAYNKGEVPIGAVIVYHDNIIATGYNCREKKQNATKHAEIIAINKACKKLKSWRLEGCEMYVTLEPCPMCAGAIANARINKVYIGAKEKTSQDNLCEKIFSSIRLNHKVTLHHLEEYSSTCSKLLTSFFKQKRK